MRWLFWTLARLVRPPERPRQRAPFFSVDPVPRMWARGYTAEDV